MDINKLLLNHGIIKAGQSSGGANETPLPPPPITNFTAINQGGGVVLSWTNPTDVNFYGVRIQRKLGSYPTSFMDGSTIFNGAATTFTDTGLSNGVTYYYRAFTYNTSYVHNDNVTQQVSATPTGSTSPTIYTVVIDSTNSNPLTSVTYADDAIGMTAGSNAWDSVFPFNEIKPVMLQNGTVNYYLNPNNFAQKLDGSAADLGGADGDVMIQFPKIYTYIRKVGNLIYASLSKSKVDANYKCYAHTKGTTEKDYLYIGAYFGNHMDGRLRSISGETTSNNRTIATNRASAEANGTGYQLYSFYQHLMIQVLYLIKYKNLDSQTAVGIGATSSSNVVAFPNGHLNTNGMVYGTTLGTSPMKLFGIENVWGNCYYFVDGIVFTPATSYLINNNNSSFNNNGSGTNYISYESQLQGEIYAYFTNSIGTTELGFMPTNSTGSSSSYYCDRYSQNPNAINCVGVAGIRYNQSDTYRAGIFYFDMSDPMDYYADNVGARLVYL